MDFIFAFFGLTLNDLVKIIYEAEGKNQEEIINTANNNLDKMRKCKGYKDDFIEKDLVRKICYYCRISEDILETGLGTFYFVENIDKKTYTIKTINEYCEKNDKVILKDMIANITGVKKNDVIEVPLKIAVNRTWIDKSIYGFIEILVDKMIESRV